MLSRLGLERDRSEPFPGTLSVIGPPPCGVLPSRTNHHIFDRALSWGRPGLRLHEQLRTLGVPGREQAAAKTQGIGGCPGTGPGAWDRRYAVGRRLEPAGVRRPGPLGDSAASALRAD